MASRKRPRAPLEATWVVASHLMQAGTTYHFTNLPAAASLARLRIAAAVLEAEAARVCSGSSQEADRSAFGA